MNAPMNLLNSEINGEPRPLWKSISFLAVLLLCGWLSLGEFISGKSAFWHDSLQGFSFQHLCFEKLLSGRLPLWMPELNAGQPLWPLTETLACYDPVALLLWPVGALSGFSSMVIFEAVCIVWLILFAFGGLLLSRLLLRNWWINLAVFALLFGGPVGWAMPTQWSYLCPFRYTPFVLLALIRAIDAPSVRNAVALGLAAALSTAGYQTNYAAWFVLVFSVFYIRARHKQEGAPFSGLVVKRLLLAAGLCALANLPLIVAGVKLLDGVAVPRLFLPGWTYPVQTFLAAISGINVPGWQGSAYVGICASAVILLCAAAAVVSLLRKGPALCGWSALECAWLETTLATLVLALGFFGLDDYFREHTFLGLRNWGLTLSLVVLCLSQLFVVGAKRMQAASDRYVLGVYWSLLLVIGAILGYSDPASFSKDWPILLVTAAAPLFLRWLLAHAAVSFFYAFLAFACIGNVLLNASFSYGTAGFERGKAFNLFLSSEKPSLPQTRGWLFPVEENYPFVVAGPALLHSCYAAIPMQRNVLALDLVRLPGYHALVSSKIPTPHLQKILGNTAPILRTVHAALPADGEQNALSLLAGLADARMLDSLAIVQGPVPENLLPGMDAVKPLPGTITLREYRETQTRVSADIAADGLLIFSDNWDSSWRVSVDGKKAPLLLANATNKAVFLAKGRHDVKFSYRPAAYLFSFWFRVLFWLLACLWLAVLYIKAHGASERNKFPAHQVP